MGYRQSLFWDPLFPYPSPINRDHSHQITWLAHSTCVSSSFFLCHRTFLWKIIKLQKISDISVLKKYVRPGGTEHSSAGFTRRIFSIGSLNILFACLFFNSFIYLLFCCFIYRQVWGGNVFAYCKSTGSALLSEVSYLTVSPQQSHLYTKQLPHIFPNLNNWHVIKTFVLATTNQNKNKAAKKKKPKRAL